MGEEQRLTSHLVQPGAPDPLRLSQWPDRLIQIMLELDVTQ